MISLKARSGVKELLDRDDIPFEDIKRNMQELDFINTALGGHAITIQGLKSLLRKRKAQHKRLHVVEIGCGGGDNLRAIKMWAQKHGESISLTGVDINPECIAFAEGQPRNNGIHFICSDYRTAMFATKPDVIFSSLFCHHFTHKELLYMLQWMKSNSAEGFFINDLHRHPLAFYAIRLLTQAFSKSYLVKNDAPLSVQRGFTKEEWTALFDEAKITHYQCRWRWAFRWLITYTHAG